MKKKPTMILFRSSVTFDLTCCTALRTCFDIYSLIRVRLMRDEGDTLSIDVCITPQATNTRIHYTQVPILQHSRAQKRGSLGY